MPNPSTLQADTEQRYHYHHAAANNLRLSKAEREDHLRKARGYAAELGIDGPEAINGRPAAETREQLAKRLIDEVKAEMEPELTYVTRSFSVADWQLIADAVSNSDTDGDTRIRLLDRLQ